ncbi:MAG: hypothetical protein AMJ41_05250 [candidate division Zixibacteria bacterium DG_27]|nr:MAG: hypothetical protein AMJ41_05250 [candidate division Zixibacteria bacterium DG_27]
MTAKPKTDNLLLFVIVLGVGFGLVLVCSNSQAKAEKDFGSPYHFLLRQSVWALLGFLFMVFLWRSDYHYWLKLSPLLLFFTLVSLVAVFFFPPKYDAWRWIHSGSYQFQPSELAKYATVMFLAYSLPRRIRVSHRKPFTSENRRSLTPYLILLMLISGLIMFEPHLGNTAIVFVSVLALLWLAGMKFRKLLLLCLPIVIVAAVMVFALNYHRDRIDAYYDSLRDPLDGAHQVRQSALALAGGGLLGPGLGEGGQKWFFLPEAHTDFIFASAGEELGFLPLSALLLFYLFLGWKSCEIASRSPDDSGFFLAVGVGTVLTVNALLNLGVVLALLPVTGVPLPFISYGGSSLFMNLVGMGLLLSVMRRSYVSSKTRLLNGDYVPLRRKLSHG